jgi:protein involved in polysaccharide export with SLBB domain
MTRVIMIIREFFLTSIWAVVAFGITQAQSTPPDQNLYEESLRQRVMKAVSTNSIGVEQYESGVTLTDQDSSFYNSTATGAPVTRPRSMVQPEHLASPDSLQIFGYNMFEGTPESFSPVLEATPPPDYRLGPGDNVLVNVWGRVDMQLDLTVDREGKVFIPKAGEIIAWGMTMDEFKHRVDNRLSSIYSDYQFSVSLGKIRRIKIFVYGEVKRPGGFTTSSLATLFNALYLAGGPTRTGSLRTIKHIRNNKVLAQIDFYRFLLKGDNSQDSKLESGDVIFVPVVGPLVRISGQVKRPAIYEIVGGERITDMVQLAGGATAEAFLEKTSIDRVAKDDSRIIQDVDLSEGQVTSDSNAFAQSNLRLQDGDRLWVPSIYDMRKNTIHLMGNVKHPGIFGLSDSMKISDLIDHGEQFKRDTYFKRANLFRTFPDQTREVYPVDLEQILAGNDSTDFLLMDKDSLVIYSQKDIRRDMMVSIHGAVRRPGMYEYFEGMRLSDLVFLAGNPLKQSYLLQAEIARANPGRPPEIIHANLERVLARDTCDDLALTEDDRVFVRTIPRYRLNSNVTIDGEVMFPGDYALMKENERLSDLLHRAGWFTPDAFAGGLVFLRPSISQDIEKLQVRGILASTEMTVLDSLNRPLPKLHETLNIKSLDRIIIDTDKLLSDPGSPDDVILQNGDYVYVPCRPSGIPVVGAIAANGTIAYKKGQNVEYYIKSAGGYCNSSDKKQTRLARANGLVLAGSKAFISEVKPGDVVIVPQKIGRDRQWLKSAATVTAIVSSLATVVLIADRMK